MTNVNKFRANKRLTSTKLNDPADIFLTLMENTKDGVTGNITREFLGAELQTKVCPNCKKSLAKHTDFVLLPLYCPPRSACKSNFILFILLILLEDHLIKS